jgi:uncharacterized protein YqgC (DUF456 family)
MTAFWWILTLVLMLVGLAGAIIPLLPGPAIILAAAVMHHFALGPASGTGWPTFLVLSLLMALAFLVDVLSGAIGAKYFGATRWGAIGGILGGVAGIFFGLPGMFLGPLLGALIGELLGGKGILPASQSTWGALLGTTAGIAARLALSLLMIIWFLAAALR